ncbi:glycosyltransferase family 4 protein [Rhizobium sp. AN80A]|uniref:glycosyltransferase family 4 protein n=1 Tax=Rhizobium sp. AN80A TaxID=3040673 RepID=UPI0024B3B056|nr:glycosyltransferase family 4 protein [Rhizobium sp. AN80A]
MRILIVSQYFWPESFIINDLARSLADNGHKITVATGKPNYPTGKLASGYRRGGMLVERFAEKVEVIRIPLRPRGSASAAGLILNYLSFLVSGLRHLPRVLRDSEFDVVFFFGVSPMTSAIPAALIARQKKAHLALWIQDLWPESLSATGFLNNRCMLWLVGLLMRGIYSRADTIFLQSPAFEDSVSSYADREKLVYLPNPAPEDSDARSEVSPELAAEFENCFSILFAGNLGRAQSVETIVGAARLLKCQPQIRFIIVGSGSESDNLCSLLKRNQLTNVVLAGRLDREYMPQLFKRASVLLVTLKDDPGLNSVIPSKVQAYMQAGKPIIGALAGEGARLIKSAECGLVVEPGDSEALAESILTLASMPDNRLNEMGSAGRRHFEENFELGNTARKLIATLKSRMETRLR